jgi:hypothetical protein
LPTFPKNTKEKKRKKKPKVLEFLSAICADLKADCVCFASELFITNIYDSCEQNQRLVRIFAPDYSSKVEAAKY